MRRLQARDTLRDFAREGFARLGWRLTNYRTYLDRGSQFQAMRHALAAKGAYAERKVVPESSSLGAFMDFYSEHAEVSRSQHAQDIFVMFATKMKRGGHFLEVGGGDGISLSNTVALSDELAWLGLLMEPDPTQYRLCQTFRASDGTRVLKAGVSPTGAHAEMTLNRSGALSALAGYEGADGHQGVRAMSNRKSRVRTLPLTEVLLRLPPLDYLSLDIEGAELEVLSSVDWDSITPPALLTVEHNGSHQKKDAIAQLLAGRGYLEFAPNESWLTGQDSWFFQPSMVSL